MLLAEIWHVFVPRPCYRVDPFSTWLPIECTLLWAPPESCLTQRSPMNGVRPDECYPPNVPRQCRTTTPSLLCSFTFPASKFQTNASPSSLPTPLNSLKNVRHRIIQDNVWSLIYLSPSHDTFYVRLLMLKASFTCLAIVLI